MKKLILILILISSISFDAFSRGGALGIQFGRVTFGLGGSSNGPIIGVGPSPDNGRCFSAVVVPGDGCGCRSGCDYRGCDSQVIYED